MIKKIFFLASLALVIAAGGLFYVGEAYAQSSEPAPASQAQGPWGYGWNRVCEGAGVVSEAISSLLGLTQEEIHAQRQDGLTLSEIAAGQGVSDQTLLNAIESAQAEMIAQAVADGRLTPEQAETALARMQERAADRLTEAAGPGGFRGQGGGRSGQGAGMGRQNGGQVGRYGAPALTTP